MKRNENIKDNFWPPRFKTLIFVRKAAIFLSMNIVEKDSCHLLP